MVRCTISHHRPRSSRRRPRRHARSSWPRHRSRAAAASIREVDSRLNGLMHHSCRSGLPRWVLIAGFLSSVMHQMHRAEPPIPNGRVNSRRVTRRSNLIVSRQCPIIDHDRICGIDRVSTTFGVDQRKKDDVESNFGLSIPRSGQGNFDALQFT